MKQLNQTQKQVLSFLSHALFGQAVGNISCDWKKLYREANFHKVFPLVFSSSKQYVTDSELLQKAEKLARHSMASTVVLNHAHVSLHKLMSEENIPYVTFKGISSAQYYPEPNLRISGDVDFYVKKKDFERCEQALEKNGFACEEHEGMHAAYQKDGVRLEQHRTFNGIPKNEKGKAIFQGAFGNLIESAVILKTDFGEVRIPDTFHHGLILLLHTLSHMTKEGIGLRHLCDWAVFEASLSNEEFVALFEKPLKAFGLWHFARILSLCAVKYLGAPEKAWQGEEEEHILNALICDIMAAGNFGSKDKDRSGQIKYITDRGEGTVKRNSALKQGLQSVAKKAELEHKSKTAVVMEYAKKVFTGKRKPDTAKTLEAAAERKALYSEFHLFEE